MKENEVNISVVMAEYNTKKEHFLQSLDSILIQSYKNFEIIIVDDCGKNDVEELVKHFNDDRIKIIKNEKNEGLAVSLNKGIEQAKGEFVIRMDTDDICIKNRFEKQIKFIQEHPEYSIVGTKHVFFDDNGEYNISKCSGEIKTVDFLKGTPFTHPSLIIRKKDLIEVGGYPNYRRCQDYAMEMEMYLNGYRGYIMDEVLLKYRQDDDSFKKRKYKARIYEYKIRKHYFKKLKMPWYSVFYQLKPLVVGLIPACIMRKLKR